MRVRQRQAAARQFVAERHRASKCGEEDAVFKPGEVVYRKGQPCTVVVVGYDTCPPHIVVRTSDGNEVGTEPSHLERLPPASPRRPLAGSTGKRSAKAEMRDMRAIAPAAPGVDEVVVSSSTAASSERHAALARMRNRRAERAAEAARERDDTLADLLADRHDTTTEMQAPRAKPSLTKKSLAVQSRHESESDMHTPQIRPVLAKPSPVLRQHHDRVESAESTAFASSVGNSPEVDAVSTQSDGTPPLAMDVHAAPATCMTEARIESRAQDETPRPLAGDAVASHVGDSEAIVLLGASALRRASEVSCPTASRPISQERASPDSATDVNSELAAEVAAEAAFEAMQDFSCSGMSVLPPMPGDLSDAEDEEAANLSEEHKSQSLHDLQELANGSVSNEPDEEESRCGAAKSLEQASVNESVELTTRLEATAGLDHQLQQTSQADDRCTPPEQVQNASQDSCAVQQEEDMSSPLTGEILEPAATSGSFEQEHEIEDPACAHTEMPLEHHKPLPDSGTDNHIVDTSNEPLEGRAQAQDHVSAQTEIASEDHELLLHNDVEHRSGASLEQRHHTEDQVDDHTTRGAVHHELLLNGDIEHRSSHLEFFQDASLCSHPLEEELRLASEGLSEQAQLDALSEETRPSQHSVYEQVAQHRRLSESGWPLHGLPEDDADDIDALLNKRSYLSGLMFSAGDSELEPEADGDAPDQSHPWTPSAEDDEDQHEADEEVPQQQMCAQEQHHESKMDPKDTVETQNGLPQMPIAPVDVLLCLDASFSMHAPLTLAQRPVTSWSEDDWDAFGKHLRTRNEPCRLEPLGLAAVDFLTGALQGLSVEVHFCGEDDSEPVHYGLVDASDVKSRWRRALLRGANLWSRVADDIARLQGSGLQQVVVLSSAEDDLGGQARCAEAYQTVGQIALAGVPVHVVRFGAQQVAQVSSSIAAASGGSHTTLRCDGIVQRNPDNIHVELAAILRSLRNLPRLHPSRPLISEAELHAAASIIQRAERARRRRQQRRLLIERRAVAHIEAAYSSWRLRRSIAAAASEGKRAKKRAPVEEALRRRKATKYQADAEAAARRIQSEWRSRRIRLWCQKIDRAARRLQGWCRTRWLRERLERQAIVEAKALEVRRRRLAQAPPPPPSQWQQLGMTLPGASGSWQVESRSIYLADSMQATNSSADMRSTASHGIRPLGSSALQACPPPMKKPPKPRGGGGMMSSLAPPSECYAPAGAPPLKKRPGLRMGATAFSSAAAATAPVGTFATSEGNLPRIGGAMTLPRLPRATGSSSSPRHRSSPTKKSPRRMLDAVF